MSGKSPVTWAVWPLWTLATTAGITLGFVLSYVVLFAIKAVVRDFNEDKWMGYWLVPILAIGVAVLQWLVLRQHVRGASLWIVANVAGLALARWAIGASIDRLSDVAALGALPGIVTGLAVVLLLRGTQAH